MFKTKCKCGESEKNFKFDIGEFYIGECCEKAGYDARGFKEGEEIVKIEEEVTVDKVAIEGSVKETEAKEQDLSKLNQKALQEICKAKGIEFKGNDSKAALREKLK